MLIPQRLDKNKSIILAVIVVASVGLTLYLLAVNFWGGASVPLAITSPKTISQPPIDTGFSSDFINREPYNKLEQHGQRPVEVGPVGRDNPFAVINYQTAPKATPVDNQPGTPVTNPAPLGL